MEVKRICTVYFSATGTTRTVVRRMGEELAAGLSEYCAAVANMPASLMQVEYDFTLPDNRTDISLQKNLFTQQDIVILGVPVYAGRVPNLLLPFLATLQGNGAIGIPVVLYGNRHFDDALRELDDIMQQCGFHTIAAGAFVGEHSFSKTLAKGRPSKDDLVLAGEFAQQIIGKINKGGQAEHPQNIPGRTAQERAYFQPKAAAGNKIDIRKVKPLTKQTCTRCGFCADHCPMGAIDHQNPDIINGICIKCCACVKSCPMEAKYFDDPGFLYHKNELEAKYQEPAPVKLFI